MRCAVFGGPRSPLRIESRPVPTADGRAVVTRVLRAGVCASDLALVRREELVSGVSTLGHELVGVVLEAPGAPELVGERVVSMAFAGCGACDACLAGRPVRCPQRRFLRNAFAQYAATTVQSCFVVPAALPDEVACLGEPAAVAEHAVRRAGDLSGSTVAIVGAGPIGLLTALTSSRAGAAAVVLVATSARRQRQADALGLTLLRTGTGITEQIRTVLGAAPDVVVDCAGAPGSLATTVRLAAPDGRVVIVGATAGDETVRPGAALGKQLDVRFSLAYDAVDFPPALDLLVAHVDLLPALITRTVGLDSFPAAFAAAAGGVAECKMLLDPWHYG